MIHETSIKSTTSTSIRDKQHKNINVKIDNINRNSQNATLKTIKFSLT